MPQRGFSKYVNFHRVSADFGTRLRMLRLAHMGGLSKSPLRSAYLRPGTPAQICGTCDHLHTGLS